MQDRQPGAPGQYKATLSAAEFQKMQAGEQFTITMIRDDQPIVDGTPYSKAAVLPDDLAAIICPDVLNPSPADALRALLPRNGKVFMTANLPMDGHRVVGLGDPAEDGDAVSLGFAKGQFAPAGHGIGSSAKSIGDANNATVGGVYYYGNTASNIPDSFGNGVIFVQNRADAQIFQKITDIYGLSAERLRQSNGTWGEWEWVNPPMALGVEYRTTERWNAQPVFTMAFGIGSLPNSTTKSVTVPDTIKNYASAVISAIAIAESGALVNIVDSASPVSMFVVTKSDYSIYTATMVVKYVK